MAQAVKAVADTEDMQRKAAELYLRARRRRGELERDLPKQHAGEYQRSEVATVAPTLAEQGIDKREAHIDYKLMDVPSDAFEEYVATAPELTVAGAVRAAEKPHVAYNSGENEWYTPAEYIDAARAVLGSIDLDPASSAEANKVIKAKHFYSITDDGLKQKWSGRVWMNPPYTSGLVEKFVSKLLAHWRSEDIAGAVVLVNNATETKWFQSLSGHASAICFPAGRIRYWQPGRESDMTGLQGQVVAYLGDDVAAFRKAFASIGECWPHE